MATEDPPASPSNITLADCSETVFTALRELQEGYEVARTRIHELQEEKGALKADARRMAEHLFGEVSAAHDRVAVLTAELEQLRGLQAQLAEAAAAEAEACRGGVQSARASEAEALRRAAALEQELRHAREEAHRLEVAQQDGRARAVVEHEALISQLDRLRAQLAAAEASAAAQRQAAELWQRKHGVLEGQLEEAQAQLQAERGSKEGLLASLGEAQQRAQQAESEARAFRQAAASSLQDLSELCSALQTAQVAMAADSSSKPAYVRALSLMEASLLRVAAASEGALSAAAGSGGGWCSSRGGWQDGLPVGRPAVPPQQQPQLRQQLESLLQPPCNEAGTTPAPAPPPLLLEGGAEAPAPAGTPGAGEAVSGEAPSRGGGGGRSAGCMMSPAGSPSALAAVTMQEGGKQVPAAQCARAELLAASSRGQQPEQRAPEPSGSQQQGAAASAGGVRPKSAPPGAVEPQTPSVAAEAAVGADKQQRSLCALSGSEQPSAFIQAFRAQHGRQGPGVPPAAPRASLESAGSCGQDSPTAQLPPAPQEQQLEQQEQQNAPAVNAAHSVAASALPAARPARHGGGARAEGSPPLRRSPTKLLPAVGASASSQGGAGQSALPLHIPAEAAAGLAAVAPAPGGVMPPRQPRAGHRRGATVVAAPLGGAGGTRDSVTAVIMAVEDELATLDLRHAALLKQSARLREARALPGDVTLELEREEVAAVVRSVREAMQRKGEQLAQLKRYHDML